MAEENERRFRVGDSIYVEKFKGEPIRATLRFFRDHPAILGTVVYIQITSVGMIYSWSLYRPFGINIFDFAEVNDFLLAAFKDPVPLIMAILTVCVVVVISYRARLVEIRREENKQFDSENGEESIATGRSTTGIRMGYFWVSIFIVLVPYTMLTPYIFATRSAEKLLENPPNEQTLYLRVKDSISTSNEFRMINFIGTTESFAFFYQEFGQKVIAVPISNIARIESIVDVKDEHKTSSQNSEID